MYGGILTNICIWSTHASASIISAFFCSHSFRSISPISFLNFPYITFLRYFGANTIWYWHLYFECAKLFISLLSFFHAIKPPCILVMRSPNHYYYTLRFYFFQVLFGLLLARRFFLCWSFSSSPGRTGGLFPRQKTPTNPPPQSQPRRGLYGYDSKSDAAGWRA